MSKDYPFKSGLEEFERRVCNEFAKEYNVRIGLSIQVLKEEQDSSSITRTANDNTSKKPTHKVINAYCKSVQKDNLEECNNFDYYSKQFVNKFKDDKEGILCMCNADVTNILRPFKFKNSNSPIFYIFYGHFLLNEKLGKYSQQSDGIYPLDLSEAIDELSNLEKYSKEFKPIKTEAEYSGYCKQETGSEEISLINYNNLREFMLKVEEEFEIFLEEFFINKNNSWEANPVLKEFINRIDPSIVRQNLKELRQSLEAWEGTDKKKIVSALKLIDKMDKVLRRKGRSINERAKENNVKLLLNNLTEWSTADASGKAAQKPWYTDGKRLLEECQNLE